MRASTRSIGSKNDTILAYNNTYLNVNKKVNKTDVTLNGDGILPAGTIVDINGKSVNTTELGSTAFGVVYEDWDFNDSMGTEVIPITIFGFVNLAKLPAAPVDAVKTALKMIQFLDLNPAPATTTTTTIV